MSTIVATPPADGGPVFWLRSVRDCLLSGLRPSGGSKALVRLSGAETSRVRLVGNDVGRGARVVTLDADVEPTAVRIDGNGNLIRK